MFDFWDKLRDSLPTKLTHKKTEEMATGRLSMGAGGPHFFWQLSKSSQTILLNFLEALADEVE